MKFRLPITSSSVIQSVILFCVKFVATGHTKRRCSRVLTLKSTFICVYWWTSWRQALRGAWDYWWTRQRIQNTFIVVDRYLRLMGDKTILDEAPPSLESFYPPWVAGIDLPHQCVVDSFNTPWVAGIDLTHQSVVDSYHLGQYLNQILNKVCDRDVWVTMVGWVDVPDNDRGDFRRRCAVDISTGTELIFKLFKPNKQTTLKMLIHHMIISWPIWILQSRTKLYNFQCHLADGILCWNWTDTIAVEIFIIH